MPILDTRKLKELEGVGQLVSELVLTLLSWMIEAERSRIKTAQREEIYIAKEKGIYTGKKLKYHVGAIGQDKIVYDTVVRLLATGESVMDIHRKTHLSRNTIYAIKREIEQLNFESIH
ncbi:recombinase [Bacillus sp. AFS002410]|nr:recombinase [Bacillus sp. AFS002410]